MDRQAESASTEGGAVRFLAGVRPTTLTGRRLRCTHPEWTLYADRGGADSGGVQGSSSVVHDRPPVETPVSDYSLTIFGGR